MIKMKFNLKNPMETASIITKDKQRLEGMKLVDAELLSEAVEVCKIESKRLAKLIKMHTDIEKSLGLRFEDTNLLSGLKRRKLKFDKIIKKATE